MRRRRLGRSGAMVSAIGLGCYGMTGAYGPADDTEALATLTAAFDAGVDLVDTSDTYSAGKNEELVGRAIKGRRAQAFVVTKFGNPGRDADGNSLGICGRPDYVPLACERSLSRLGIEFIDLYLLHRVDPTVPIEETIGAMGELVKQGKVKHIGLCEAAPATIRRANAVHPLACVQSEYSLWTRDPETGGHLAACREFGTSFMAYSPLGRGFLAGAVEAPRFGSSDPRGAIPRFAPENLAHNLAALERFKALAAEFDATPAQLALAWLLAQGEDILPIPGTRNRRHLRENIAAAELHLTSDDVRRIDSAISLADIRGRRYAEDYMRCVDI
jgi:aryl-alcohol dehydrogenase-like predicted oxidoreductase